MGLKGLFFYTILLPYLLFGDLDSFFADNQDPSTVHHVNVITGHIHFAFQDIVAEGAVPISLTRAYSSSSALQPITADPFSLGSLGHSLSSDWAILPHAHLMVVPHKERKKYAVYVAEPCGSIVAYKYSNEKAGDKHTMVLIPRKSSFKASGQLSARTALHKIAIELNLKTGVATVLLPDSGKRIYRGTSLHHYASDPHPLRAYSYHLEQEIFPSKHQLHYFYNPHGLIRIEAKNPNGQKIYSHIAFDRIAASGDAPYRIQLNTSDRKEIWYYSEDRKRYDEFTKVRRSTEVVRSNFRPIEKSHFKLGRKGIDASLHSVDIDGKQQFRVTYFRPSDEEHEKKWIEHPEKKHFYIDKVEAIYGPLGPNGSEIQIATFTYHRDRTTVRDADNVLTEYYHDGEKLSHILYHDPSGHIALKQQFIWNDSRLLSKRMLDAEGKLLFAKTFKYDGDNVIQEVLWGNLTGEDKTPNSYPKTYSYYKNQWNLLQSVSEENGPTYEYFYKPGTDLLTAKFTKNPLSQIVIREFCSYDEDHFLIEEIIDNGISPDPSNLTQVTERILKRTTRNPHTSLPEVITESYWDPLTQSEKLLRKTKLTYAGQKVVEEAIYDANDMYRYTIYTTYDLAGRIQSRTEPLSLPNTYQYNAQGLLEKSKETGSPPKVYTYDAASRLLTATDTETGKTTSTSYGAKSQVLLQTDERGNTTHYQYNPLGHRTATRFPPVKDQHGQTQEPTASFSYNALGDLTRSALPLNQVTQTTYNLFRKPVRITQSDGTEIRHTYNTNGTLAKTTHPDGTQEVYQYDFLQRLIAKQILTSANTLLSSEHWEYNAFQLIKYTAPNGLVTQTFYDGAGRKIAEQAANRKVTLTYDALGFLESTNNGAILHVQKRNVLGLIEEEWQEDLATSHIENHMRFVYDKERRKISATRVTSQGESQDHFTYHNYKLSKHTDPHNAITQFLYNEDHINDLGQKVLQKTTISPLHIATLETYDAANRLQSLEKQDAAHRTLSKEEYFYDLAGNLAKRLSHVYQDAVYQKTLETTFSYDNMGRVLEELEAHQKKTTFSYDNRGRLVTRTLPSGVQLTFTYDPLGRLLTRTSSDGTIADTYAYDTGPDPIFLYDNIRGIALYRDYNLFGELIRERTRYASTLADAQPHPHPTPHLPIPAYIKDDTTYIRNTAYPPPHASNLPEEASPEYFGSREMRWTYDTLGRATSLHLPDGSSILYDYRGAHLRSIQRLSRDTQPLYQHHYEQFDANGRLSQESLIYNLGTIHTTHDLLERPASQTSPWLTHSTTYGPSSLVTSEQNTLLGNKTFAYDPLDQLIQENDTSYQFDSLSNPVDAQVNDLNQLISSKECHLSYDPNGNPTHRASPSGDIAYSFDALGRLTTILYPDRKVHFTYDSLSRLFSKAIYQSDGELQQEHYYLYDQNREIGTLNATGQIQELKVLGLGISGDIGAAIALELNDEIYAPLHDFHGHIIALLNTSGQLVEQYAMDAFGRDKTPLTTKNPWRFCSKRTDEHLIFFGLRFYDPSLGRWLTPDPAGFVDGPNLYAYVRNSPTNRLDLFGLYEEEGIKSPFFRPGQINLTINNLPMDNGLIRHTTIEFGVEVNYFISCHGIHELDFTPEERESGVFNLFDHKELFPAAGKVNLVTYGHGIGNNLNDIQSTAQWISDQLPGTLFIAQYTGTGDFWQDMEGAIKDVFKVVTVESQIREQFMLNCSNALAKVNPAVFDSSGALQQYGALWMHIDHSRGGAIDLRAMQRMSTEQRHILQTQLLMTCVAPAATIPRHYGISVTNFYSTQDFITGWAGNLRETCATMGCILGGNRGQIVGGLIGALCFDQSDCDIKFVPCISKWSERTFGADHGIMGGTYKGVIIKDISHARKNYGFYERKRR